VTRQLVLDLAHRPALRREDFLVAACNESAVAWIDRWPDWQGGALALFGASGSGKSHLAEVWRARSGGVLIDYADLNVDAVPGLARAGAVVLDNADKVRDMPALLHLINLLRQDGGYLLCLSVQAPGRWQIPLADLRSRLNAMLSVGIAEPDDHLLGAVMVKMLSDRQLRPSLEVISFLVARIERSFAAARAAVVTLDTLAAGEMRPVNLALARKALAHMQEIGDSSRD
jgi:chromosomal replication initiation ATPase DnaA